MDRLHDALGISLGRAGDFLGLLQVGYVDKRNDHAVNDVLYRAVGQEAHEVASVGVRMLHVSFLRGERAQHLLGLADQIGADEAWRKVGDGPADYRPG